jgi:hypothetical protein
MFRRLTRIRSLIVIGLVAIAALSASAPVSADSYGGPWPCNSVRAHVGTFTK